MPWCEGWWGGPAWGGPLGAGLLFPFLGPLMGILFLLLVFVLLHRLLLGHPWWGGHGQPGSSDRALAMLRHRFASGDISEQEYEARRRLLEN